MTGVTELIVCYDRRRVIRRHQGSRAEPETYQAIYQTQGSVFIKYLNTEKWVETTRRRPVFFNQLRSVWISDETLFRVFDIASLTLIISNSKEKVHRIL